jgi:hypothetical protein
MPVPTKTSSKKTFTVNGKPLTLSNRQKAIQFLDKLPFKQMLTSKELAAKVSIHPGDWALTHPDLAGYSHIASNVKHWGSRETIAALKKHLGASN